MNLGKALRYALLLLLLTGPSFAVSEQAAVCPNNTDSGHFTFERTDLRYENKEECFAEEFAIINRRRKNQSIKMQAGPKKPAQIVGLGLSGGGIKSSAFQLGLLSGLHSARNEAQKPLLVEVDYIASASGGSWASGAYWATEETGSDFFACLDSMASFSTVKQNCHSLQSLLPEQQSRVFGSRQWHQQIKNDFLLGRDIALYRSPEKEFFHYREKPFPIFMATHSNTIIGKKSTKNFPFEMTPLGFATIADCNSEKMHCGFFRRYLRPLHWNNRPEKGFYYGLDHSSGDDIRVKKYLPRDHPDGLYLSDALWASGGLVAKVMSLHLHLRDPSGEPIAGIRKKYVLSDAGKADNVGLIPLAERGVDLIIISQMASDTGVKFNDLKRSSHQVSRLFGAELDLPPLTSPQKPASAPRSLITASCIDYGQHGKGTILLIKPTPYNIDPFYSFLKNSPQKGMHKLHRFLVTTEKSQRKSDQFPQNKTIRLNYDRRLIFAYYNLGRYIAENELSRRINQWLANGSQCQ